MRLLVSVIFFLVLASTLKGQLVDRFTDGDFTNQPSWYGDGADFNVNSSGMLQLSAVGAGTSFLSVPFNQPNLDSVEWRFKIRLNFNPSSSNYARVYLTSDSSNSEGSLNGYYLQFGESLSADAIELYRQSGTTSTRICRGTDGKISAAFTLYVKVMRINGDWSIYSAPDSLLNYSEEATGYDNQFNSSSWFSFRCTFTSGNVQNFYLDDVYAGPFVKDTVPPEMASWSHSNINTISLCFSEAVDTSVYDVLKYYLNGIHPQQISHLSDNCYELSFANSFLTGARYTLNYGAITDLSGNSLMANTFSFVFYPSGIGSPFAVIINEIYFEPLAAAPLPDAEFIELYNRSAVSIDLSGWSISDGSSTAVFPSVGLDPGQHLLVHASGNEQLFSAYNNQIGIASFPSLNNDVGDRLQLLDSTGVVIDVLNFSDESYHNSNKKNGGWTIERIDGNFTCPDIGNWSASDDALHGTPGKINSVNGSYADTLLPFIVTAFPIDSNHIEIDFSESVVTGTLDLLNYSLSVAGQSNFLLDSVYVGNSEQSVVVKTSLNLPNEKLNLTVHAIADCAGNPMQEQSITIGFPEEANQKEILINELLFYARDDGTDYVELYNASGKLIDLKDWTITETEFADINLVRTESKITSEHYFLWPGRYTVLSKDKKKIINQYTCKDLQSFLDVATLPDYNASDGSAVLYDASGKLIDRFSYSDEMHFPLLSDHKGVSLERTSFAAFADSAGSWHSAAGTAGFGTPGYRNSQLSFTGEEEIKLEPELFSPDNDGYQDLLTIHYKYPINGTVVSVYIYDIDGRLVKKILDGETVANEGVSFWDGTTDSHDAASAGTYILIAEAFDLTGNRSLNKKAIVLLRRG